MALRCSPTSYRFNEFIIFGDSLSDSGNTYRFSNKTWPIVPPYRLGRFVKGTVTNYAEGGATTDSNFVQGYTKRDTAPAPDVRQQVAKYINEKVKKSHFSPRQKLDGF